jgi:hypothetical protein
LTGASGSTGSIDPALVAGRAATISGIATDADVPLPGGLSGSAAKSQRNWRAVHGGQWRQSSATATHDQNIPPERPAPVAPRQFWTE